MITTSKKASPQRPKQPKDLHIRTHTQQQRLRRPTISVTDTQKDTNLDELTTTTLPPPHPHRRHHCLNTRPGRQWHRRPWHHLHSPAPPPPRARPGTPGIANGLNEHRHHQHHHRRTGTTHRPRTDQPPTTNTPATAPHRRQHHPHNHGTYHTSTTGGDVGHTTSSSTAP